MVNIVYSCYYDISYKIFMQPLEPLICTKADILFELFV